ncbi:MAG: YetF domain-containing protein [Bacteroidota bacterium]
MKLLEISLPFADNPIVNIVLRALIVYVFMIIAIRVFGKKELAQLSVIDLVFILLISNSVQNAMVGPDTTLEGGLIAATALFAANFTLKKLLYRNKTLSNLVQGGAVLLIYKGKVREENCVKAEITLEELAAAVREHGAQEIKDVDLAMLEVDGNISVISSDFSKRSVVSHPKKHKLKGRILQN